MAAPHPPPPPADRGGFHLAIVCALKLEVDTVSLLFDEIYERPYGRVAGDNNHYSTGRVGNHAVVLLLLPDMGTRSAASSAAALRIAYPNVELALIVGVCGGLPRIDGDDTFLGDVVVSKSIFNYDFGRQYSGEFVAKTTVEDTLGRAGRNVRSFLASLETEHQLGLLQRAAAGNLASLRDAAKSRSRRADYRAPRRSSDRIFAADYPHRHLSGCAACAAEAFCEEAAGLSCAALGCDEDKLLSRRDRRPLDSVPRIFMGKVASGNAVLKSGKRRDEMARRHGVVAFEMEGAGTWDEVPSIVVKGICDYADSHKNKAWQDFAAATAAAVAVAMLGRYEVAGAGGVVPGAAAEDLSRQTPDQTAGSVQNLSVDNHSIGSHSVNNHTTEDLTALEHNKVSGHLLQGLNFQGGGNVFNFGALLSRPPEPKANGPHWLVPRAGHPLFTGRSSIIQTIMDAITANEKQGIKTFVLTGLAGQGKSEVCLQVANRVRDQFWGVFWVDVSTSELAKSGFSEISALLELPESPDVVEQIKRALAALGPDKDWLLILDNADDDKTDYAKYLPPGGNGAVLVTSRLRGCAALGRVGWEELHGMGMADCVDLLLRATRPQSSKPGSRQAAQEVVRLLSRHTLAVVLAGAYVQMGRCSLAECAGVVRQQLWRFFQFSPEQSRPRYGSLDKTFHASVVRLALSKSYHQSDSYHILITMAAMDFKELPLDLLGDAFGGLKRAREIPEDESRIDTLTRWHAGVPPFLKNSSSAELFRQRLGEAVSRLQSLGFLKRDKAKGFEAVSVHPLVHKWLGMRLKTTARLRHAKAAAVVLALAQFNAGSQARPYRAHVEAHMQSLFEEERWLADPKKPSRPELQMAFQGCYFLKQLRSIHGNKMLDRLSSRLWKHVAGSGPEEESAATAGNLPLFMIRGSVLMRRRKNKESLRVLEEASRAAEELPEDSKDRLEFQEQLALAYGENKRFDKEINVLEDVLRLRTAAGGRKHATLGYSHGRLQNYLVRGYLDGGRLKEGIELCELLVDDRARRYPKDSDWLLATRAQLATAYFLDGQFEAAVEGHRAVVELRETSLPKDHADTIDSKFKLAEACLEVGKLGEAADLLREVARVRAVKYKADDPVLLKTRRLLEETLELEETFQRLNQSGAGSPASSRAVDMMISTFRSDVAVPTALEDISVGEKGRLFYLPMIRDKTIYILKFPATAYLVVVSRGPLPPSM
ncbi:hypothetical protein RB597_005266 [Gaeumannomyces tritici]